MEDDFQSKLNLSLKINPLSPSINFSTDFKESQTWENIPPPHFWYSVQYKVENQCPYQFQF